MSACYNCTYIITYPQISLFCQLAHNDVHGSGLYFPEQKPPCPVCAKMDHYEGLKTSVDLLLFCFCCLEAFPVVHCLLP